MYPRSRTIFGGAERVSARPAPQYHIGLFAGSLQATLVGWQAAVHQQPAALICAADIWNACRTSSRSIDVIFGLS
jgi:hypothetical protein